MDNISAIFNESLKAPETYMLQIAQRERVIRKKRKLSRADLSKRSNVSYGSLKKFEQTGEISLISLTKIAMELGLAGELKSLFTQPAYLNIEEVVNDAK